MRKPPALEALGEALTGNFDGDLPFRPRISGAVHLAHTTRRWARGFRKDRATPLLAAIVHVSSELAFILNSARLVPVSGVSRNR
jgi:hypothetical protein